jgi:putative oxidoreductase
MLEGRYASQALSLLRIVTALLFLMHGTGKLFGFPPIGMNPPAMSLYWIAGLIEIIGALLLIAGLFSRFAAFILSGEMAVAYWMVHAPQSTFPIINHGESAILFCFVFLLIAAAGPGPWSIDASLRHRRTEPVRDINSEGMTTLP